MSDLISRKAVLKHIEKIRQGAQMMDDIRRASIIMNGMDLCEEAVMNQPSAQPEIIRCKDCKHWRDSDGVYRRGVNAESKCPLNTKEVYAGTFYCGDAERRTDG